MRHAFSRLSGRSDGHSRALEASRAALAERKVGKALRTAWDAANDAVRRDDAETLADILELSSLLTQEATGREQRQARMLHEYVFHCLEDVRSGVRRVSIVDQLFGRRSSAATKRCPDCAERIQAAARACRFCGYRFE